MDYTYNPAPSCDSEDNKHDLIDTDPPFFAVCSTCGTRFYLVAESVMNARGTFPVERPTLIQK
ncbi:hypothetical protein LCGC14_1432840 [marine sediment metagenome]|uniref:Uncharacterized protein n=1 Tax=marine sediment metagenome TaxID=412755 RepID=A0A0F9JN05_9ZZZZ